MQKIRNIEALRFIFCIIIVYFHIFHNNLYQLYENSLQIRVLRESCTDACFIVELFFILSGFFLYRTYEKYKTTSILKFCVNKFFRLWPVLAFSIICLFILHAFGLAKFNGYINFFNLLLCQCNGISKNYTGINWYVSSLFWVLIFYFALLKNVKNNIVNFIIALMTYFSYVCLVDLGFGRAVVLNFISLGVLRGIAGIGFGYLIGLFVDNLQKINIKVKIPRIINYIVISGIEIYCFIFLTYNFIFHKISYRNPMLFVFSFVILLITFVFKKGLLSKLFDNYLSVLLGKYAYSIYVMQQISFYIMQATIWKNSNLVLNHINICMLISISFSILIGIMVYHLIEKPCVDFYKNKITIKE